MVSSSRVYSGIMSLTLRYVLLHVLVAKFVNRIVMTQSKDGIIYLHQRGPAADFSASGAIGHIAAAAANKLRVDALQLHSLVV